MEDATVLWGQGRLNGGECGRGCALRRNRPTPVLLQEHLVLGACSRALCLSTCRQAEHSADDQERPEYEPDDGASHHLLSNGPSRKQRHTVFDPCRRQMPPISVSP